MTARNQCSKPRRTGSTTRPDRQSALYRGRSSECRSWSCHQCRATDVPGGDLHSNTGALAGLNGIDSARVVPWSITRWELRLLRRSTTTSLYIHHDHEHQTACFGGTANQSTSASQIGLLSFPLQQGTGFFYGSYKITPDIQASMMLNYGYDRSHSSSLTILQSAVIKSDNAYLNPSLLQAMKLDAGDPGHCHQHRHGWHQPAKSDRYFAVRHPRSAPRPRNRCASSIACCHPGWRDRRQLVLVGRSPAQRKPSLRSLSPHRNHGGTSANATDAVTVTAANAGKSGLVPGTVACRTTLTRSHQWLRALGHHGHRGREPAGGELCGRQ